MKKILYVCHDPILPLDNGGIFDQLFFYKHLNELGHELDLIITLKKNQKDETFREVKKYKKIFRNYSILQFVNFEPFQVTSRSELKSIKISNKYDAVIATEHCLSIFKNKELKNVKKIIRRNNIESSYALRELKNANLIKKIFYLREYLLWKWTEYKYKFSNWIHLFVSETELNDSPYILRKYYLPAQSSFKIKKNIIKNRVVLGFIGSLDINENKKAAELLEQFGIANKNFDVVIGGRRSDYSLDYEENKGNLKIFYNFSNSDEVWDKINIFVVLSSHSEGVKVKIIEALGRGKVVFACKEALDGLPEGISDACYMVNENNFENELNNFIKKGDLYFDEMVSKSSNFYSNKLSPKLALNTIIKDLI